MDSKVKKVNAAYLFGYIFIPLLVIALGVWAGYIFFHDGGTGAVVCFMGAPAIAIVWWIFGGSTIFRMKKKQLEKDLDASGFTRNQTFYGRNSVVTADARTGQIALLFFWNPFQPYIIPATRVGKTWVEDGAGGAGFLRGTSRVSFLFIVDDEKIRVDTFVSNQRWKMDDPRILEAISKADLWVKVLQEARERASV